MLDSRPLGTFPEYTGTSADKASSLVDEIDEDALLFTHVSSRTVLVPRVQSMQEYILKHHKRMVLSALNQQIRSGMLECFSIPCVQDAPTIGTNDLCLNSRTIFGFHCAILVASKE